MRMKGYLCSKDGSVVLSRNSMTIGRSDCDINIDDPRVESCHAVLEFNADKQCYVLRDLNTPNGTYVNECKVQNNAVYVTNGDQIRFGQGGKPYEVRLTETCEHSQEARHRPGVPSGLYSKENCWGKSLPEIHLKRPQVKPFTLPRPPSRPRSACELDRIHTHIANSGMGDSPPSARQAWADGQFLNGILKPKLQSMLEMVDEMGSLANLEERANKKDAIVGGLRDKISEIYQQISESKFAANQNLAHELYHMERELEDRRSEVSLLRQQLDTAMQSSPTMTTQIADKEKLIHELRHDLDKSKREYSMSQGLVQSLQRELTVQEADNKRKVNEINQLKRSLRDKDVQFQSLTAKFVRVHDCRTKDEAINSVNEEMKTLKQKIRRLESRSGDHTSLIQRYKNEIQQLNEVIKKQENEKESASKKVEEQRGKYLELQRSERLLRVDVEQVKARITRFRGKISRVLYSASGIRAPDYPDDGEDSRLIVDLEKVIMQREKDKEDIRSLSREAEQVKQTNKERETSMVTIREAVDDILSSLASNGHHIEVLKNKQENLLALELEDSVSWMKQSLIDILKSEEQWLAEIYDALQKANCDVEVAEKTPGHFVTSLHRSLLDKQAELDEMSTSMKELESKHREELNNTAQEVAATLDMERQKVREEEREERQRILSDLKAELDEKHDTELHDISDKIQAANQTIDELKEALSSKEADAVDLEQKLKETLKNLEKSQENATALREELKTIFLQQKEEKQSLSATSDLARQEFDKEIEQYKEEIKQHSITIVQMEERIQGIMKQLRQAQDETERLRAELRESDQAKHRLAPSPPVVIPTFPPPVIDIGSYEQTIAVLRSELLTAQTQLHLQQTDITNLQRELSSSKARMSDMRSELSEPIKEQLENGHRVIREKELENAKLRESLHKLSKLVDKQKSEIGTMRQELKETKMAIVPHQDSEQPKSASPCVEPIRIETTDAGTQDSRGGRISAELTSLGAECRGDRHIEVIQRQREALAELRATIKALNNSPPVAPGSEELAQQVFLLKKELAEIRARQVMENDAHFRDQLSFSQSGDASARDIAPTHLKPIDAEIERTARLQLEDTLNMSEQSYMDVCNVVGGLLNIGTMAGMHSANHLPVDERQKLADGRRKDLESISQQIKSITNRLERKDNLLQNYDKDLARLREAEETATQKTAKVSVLLDEITTKSEENAHLREALRRTEERLNQEKRLNTAIKEKKTFHLENLDRRHAPPKHGECISGEFEEEAQKSRQKRDKSNLMKKEYEIQVLRQKLRSQEQELCQTSAHATNLQQRQMQRASRSGTSSDSSSVSSKSSRSRSSRTKELA